MSIENINAFCRGIDSTQAPRKLAFKSKGINALLYETEFIIADGKIMYSPSLKFFGDLFLNYLKDAMTLSVCSHHEELAPVNIFIDFKLLVWLTIKSSRYSDIAGVVDLSKKIFVKCAPINTTRFKFLLGERIESMIAVYFQSSPKPLLSFFENYPSVDKEQYQRSIVALALIGVAELTQLPSDAEIADKERASEPGAASPPKTSVQSKKITPDAMQKVKGLMKILHHINQ